MSVYKAQLKLRSHGESPSYINITPDVRKAIEESGISEGICTVISPHTTCGVFFEEFVHDMTEDDDEFLQADLNDVLGKIIPDQVDGSEFRYPGPEHLAAVRSWPSAASYLPNDDISDLYNGDAHLKATLIGSSQCFEVTGGKLAMGVTGYIYFVDFDRTRPRDRKCSLVIMGE